MLFKFYVERVERKQKFNIFFLLFINYHFSLSFTPAENVDDFKTSPISSRQKLKLLMVHM